MLIKYPTKFIEFIKFRIINIKKSNKFMSNYRNLKLIKNNNTLDKSEVLDYL